MRNGYVGHNKSKKYQNSGLRLKHQWMFLQLLFYGILMFTPLPVYAGALEENEPAAEQEETETELDRYFDFTAIDAYLERTEEGVKFSEIVKAFIVNDRKSGIEKFWYIFKNQLFLEITLHRRLIRKILVLAFITALFAQFAGAFRNSQVSDMGFLVCYTAIMVCLFGSYRMLAEIAYNVLKTIADFMRALLPVYTVSVGMSDGQAGAAGFYEMALGIIGGVEFVTLRFLFPAINLYTGIAMVNHLGKEDYLSKSCELLRSGVSFLLKGMLTVVMGLNIIQKMFEPLSGGLGGTAAKTMIHSLSGITFAGNGIAELLYGTGKIMKSAIGGAGVVLLTGLSLVPLVKMIVFILSFQLTGAIVQPVSDKRITDCISSVSEGAAMLLHVVFVMLILFSLTIAIICIG